MSPDMICIASIATIVPRDLWHVSFPIDPETEGSDVLFRYCIVVSRKLNSLAHPALLSHS